MSPIPDLDWDYPPCSLCYETVASDGSACWCDHCDVVWDADGTKGERNEPALDPDEYAAATQATIGDVL